MIFRCMYQMTRKPYLISREYLPLRLFLGHGSREKKSKCPLNSSSSGKWSTGAGCASFFRAYFPERRRSILIAAPRLAAILKALERNNRDSTEDTVHAGSSMESPAGPDGSVAAPARNGAAVSAGRLIVNGDDWGRDQETTERMLECVRCGAVSSVSAMVFMQDSERAAGMAREHGVDAGLHLNFTSPFTAANCPRRLLEHQRAVGNYLGAKSAGPREFTIPGSLSSFEYVVAAQIEEYTFACMARRRNASTATITCTCLPTCCWENFCRPERLCGGTFPQNRAKSFCAIAFSAGLRTRLADAALPRRRLFFLDDPA